MISKKNKQLYTACYNGSKTELEQCQEDLIKCQEDLQECKAKNEHFIQLSEYAYLLEAVLSRNIVIRVLKKLIEIIHPIDLLIRKTFQGRGAIIDFVEINYIKIYLLVHDLFFPTKVSKYDLENEHDYLLHEYIAREARVNAFTNEDLKYEISKQFKEYLGCEVNLENPKTFQDKIAWLKLYYQHPILTLCADKSKVKAYVKDKTNCSDELFVKQIALFSSASTINFNKLPNSYVLKSNWGSGQQIIVKDKTVLDINKTRATARRWLYSCSNHYFAYFEYCYKNIAPKIICEEFLDFEYKLDFWCFNGKVEFLRIIFDDKTSLLKAYFNDLDWKRMQLMQKQLCVADKEIEKPECFEQMLDMATKISADFPLVRVDFYVLKQGFKFCELTFYPSAGVKQFAPEEYNEIVGNMLVLPNEVIMENKK